MTRMFGTRVALGAATIAALQLWMPPAALSLAPRVPQPREFAMTDPGFRPSAAASVRTSADPRAARRTYRSQPLRAPHRFNLVGLSWQGRYGIRIWLRARAKRGTWSRWHEVIATPDDGPDPGARESTPAQRSTQPTWTWHGDYLQYRLRGRLGSLRDLRLHFVNTTGIATPLDGRRSVTRRRADAALAVNAESVFGSAAATSAMPQIVSRSQWGGDQCKPRAAPSYGEVDLAFVHHTVSLNDYTPQESASIVLGICLYHRNTNGWNDIGYDFLVDKYGQIFEGREGGIDKAVIGAQAQGYNSVSTGVANIGEFGSIGQTPAGLGALEKLLAWKLSLHGVPAEGNVTVTSGGGSLNLFPAGQQVTLNRISGHRDGDSTECPGGALYEQLPQIRAATAQQMIGASKPEPAKVTLAASRMTVLRGKTAKLKGQVTATDGSPVTSRRVRIQAARGHGWHGFRRLRTNQQGLFAIRFRLSASGAFRARLSGSGKSGRIKSATVRVKVRRQTRRKIRAHVRGGPPTPAAAALPR